MAATPNMYSGTPTITVTDNCGLAVRTVEFNRTRDHEALDTQITHHIYNAAGYLESSIDPRFFTALAINPSTDVQHNMAYITNLAGEQLRVNSIDAGIRIRLADVTGALHKTWDEQGTKSRYEYDDALHRPVAAYIQRDSVCDGAELVAERFIYGDGTVESTDKNLNMRLIGHYDHAGLAQTSSMSLAGQPLVQTRQLLKSKVDDSHWSGDVVQDWQSKLDATVYTSQCTYNALSMILMQLDAKGNRQRSEYDVTGAVNATYFQVSGSNDEQSILAHIDHNANGQVISETAGNGVNTSYLYDEQDWRLQQTITTRLEKSGRSAKLQHLHYEYDRVGNILSVDDSAEAPRFYKNQRVLPKQTYTYDALYQLISATGRENDKAPTQVASLPKLNDSAQYVNYSRTYRYDRGGNLHMIVHHANNGSQYTLKMAVSDKSNRVIQQNSDNSIMAGAVDSYFDTHGNIKLLEHSKNLIWGRTDQLKQVSLTNLKKEVYQYSGLGSRLRKFLSDSNTGDESEVVYLPGLELRVMRKNGIVIEALQVVSMMNTGHNKVRMLHWEKGKPTDISNNQLRYNLDNHLGSCNLELDEHAAILTQEEYYPFGGSALWRGKNSIEVKYKTVRYSGKERDATGLYYYGYRYYMPWMGRWLNPDPAWTIDGLNLYRMVRNNPVTLRDKDGRSPDKSKDLYFTQAHVKAWNKQTTGAFKKENEKLSIVGKKIGQLVRNPYEMKDYTSLDKELDTILADKKNKKYADTIHDYKKIISHNLPLGIDECNKAVDEQVNFSGKGDLSDKRLQKIRRKILVSDLKKDGYTLNRMYTNNIQAMADKGVKGNEWIGRGMCASVTEAIGGHSKEVEPYNGGTNIKWNHHFNTTGGSTFTDGTWKQFFQGQNTSKLPGIFDGSAQDFMNLKHLSEESKKEYLTFIGYIKHVK